MLYNFRDELLIVNDFGNSKILECESLAFCRPINSCNKPVLALVFWKREITDLHAIPGARAGESVWGDLSLVVVLGYLLSSFWYNQWVVSVTDHRPWKEPNATNSATICVFWKIWPKGSLIRRIGRCFLWKIRYSGGSQVALFEVKIKPALHTSESSPISFHLSFPSRFSL